MKSIILLFITIVILILFPKFNFGQTAPTLGATSGFALFTATGAFDNTGTTLVTGDIGSNSASVTGFPPGSIVGIIHASDATTVQAASDVATAYSDLTQAGSVIGVTLGNGQILTPGVYQTGAASTLNSNLTLDGQNDPNALFIIRIGGAFATSINSTITLIDSASLCNVYWQIGGQFDLNDGSTFMGTVIVDGAINLLSGSTLLGRGLSTGGAISLYNNVVRFLPATAGTITGTAAVCQGQTGVIYTVPPITDAAGYIWTLPAGATITAGANTNSVSVTFGSTSGNIAVQGSSSCGNGMISANYAVTVALLSITSDIYHQ